MGKRARSAATGRFIKMSTAMRSPQTTVLENTKRSGGKVEVTVARSAVDRQFISLATAQRRPNSALIEKIKR